MKSLTKTFGLVTFILGALTALTLLLLPRGLSSWIWLLTRYTCADEHVSKFDSDDDEPYVWYCSRRKSHHGYHHGFSPLRGGMIWQSKKTGTNQPLSK